MFYEDLKRPILFGLLIMISILWLGPVLLTLLTAMKTMPEYISQGVLSFPEGITPLFNNIQAAYNMAGLGPGFINSLYYAVLGSVFAIIISSLAAYSITKLKIKGGFVLFIIIFSGTIFPFQLYLIPLYQIYNTLNIYDTRFGMVLFYTTISIPFCLFVLRNYFSTIPDSLIEAAQIDGASPFKIYRSIIMPTSIPALLILFLFQFTWIWNDLIFGLMLTSSVNVRPVMTSLMLLAGEFGVGNVPQTLAGTLLVSMPTLFVFLMLQKKFLAGLKLTTAGE